MNMQEHHFVTRDGQEMLYCRAIIRGKEYEWASLLPLSCSPDEYDLSLSVALRAMARSVYSPHKHV